MDNDCDGEIDEDTVVSDDDGDGWTELDGDCDDGNPSVYPGADPLDGVMNADCDGEADTGWWSDDDTGEPEDTGATDDTGDPDTGGPITQDTGLTEDTGDAQASDSGASDDTGEAIDTPETDKTENSSCGCATPANPTSGFGVLGLALLGLVRRRGDAQ